MKKFILGVLLLTLASVQTQAATTDDLRAYLGKERITDPDVIYEVASIIKAYPDASQEAIDFVNEKFGITDLNMHKSLLEDEYNSAVEDFTTAFTSGATVNNTTYLLNTCYDKYDSILDIDKNIDKITFDTANDSEAAYNYAVSLAKSETNTYNIGSIGDSMQCIVNAVPKIIKPFGRITYTDGTIEDNYYVTIEVNTDKIVRSQFRGKVTEVKYNKDTKEYLVTVKSGNFLTYTYKGLSSVVVKKGQKIDQYQTLGSPSSYLDLQVKLNTLAINPVLLWGSTGEECLLVYKSDNKGVAIEYDGYGDTTSVSIDSGDTDGDTLGWDFNVPASGLDTSGFAVTEEVEGSSTKDSDEDSDSDSDDSDSDLDSDSSSDSDSDSVNTDNSSSDSDSANQSDSADTADTSNSSNSSDTDSSNSSDTNTSDTDSDDENELDVSSADEITVD